MGVKTESEPYVVAHQCFDPDVVNMVIKDEDIWNATKDDLCGEREDFDIKCHSTDNMVFIVTSPAYPYEKVDLSVIAGLFAFQRINSITFEVHTMILKEYRGRYTDVSARGALALMFSATDCKKVVTHVPVFNEPAVKLAKRVGMVGEGVNRKSFLRDGEVYDQLVFGITKDEFLEINKLT